MTAPLPSLPDTWRKVLSARSMKDKIGVAIDCDIAPVGELNIVSELVREGILVWIDRACLPQLGLKAPAKLGGELLRRGLNADIYRLTPKGVALCDAYGIKRQ
jgi:hypothetical protein